MALGVPILVLIGLELVLRLFGYGDSTRFFVARAGPGQLTTNPRFAWQFYPRETATTPTPLLCSVTKPPGVARIFVLGESAAAGTPDPAFGFARILEVLLRREYPSNRFEVLNVAMRGVNSHIILPIARECAGLSPDLFVVYMGNNELIGLHAPSPDEINLNVPLALLRLGQDLKATRLAQGMQASWSRVGPKTSPPAQDMEYMRRQRLAFDDPRREPAYGHFKVNLADICGTARKAGAGVVLASVAVNVHDFPPLGSLHRRDLSDGQLAEWTRLYTTGQSAEALGQFEPALAAYEAAARIDDHYAELHFRLGRCFEAAGRTEPARAQFALAKDMDALQFRADGRLNSLIRSVATNAEPQAVQFVDVEHALSPATAAEQGSPGQRLFRDHVHFTFTGDYEVAKALFPGVVAALKLGAGSGALPTLEECADALAFTPVDDLNVRAAMVRQTARPPFLDQANHAERQAEAERRVQEQLSRTTMTDFEQAAAVYRRALAGSPDDWMFHYNYANLLSQFHRAAAAVPEYEFVVQRLPRHRTFRLAYGNALLEAGRALEAIGQFDLILQTDPDFQPARDSLTAARRKLR